jgi:predicted small integral membrane protein
MDKIVLAGQIFWMTFGVATVIACLLSSRSRRAMLIARAMVGMVMLVGGALLNTAYLLAGNDYAVFMDASWFPWVTETWRAVVPPNQVLLIGLLILFEAAVGVLILMGGRMTQLGLACAIAFHLALCVMGWGVTLYALAMLAGLVLLLRAERHAAGAEAHPQQQHPVQVRS